MLLLTLSKTRQNSIFPFLPEFNKNIQQVISADYVFVRPSVVNNFNKHSVSIAYAIHVPYRPQTISKRHNYERIQKSNLQCQCIYQISISQKTTGKCLENSIFTKGNNSCKSMSSLMKLELDLYYVNANSYTKFQFKISKDCREKSGKQNFSKGQ